MNPCFSKTFNTLILSELSNDPVLEMKDGGGYLLGRCPQCREKELFISKEKPFVLKCNRRNKCGYEEHTRQRYSHLYRDLSKKHPPTAARPNATAEAYLSLDRNFDLGLLKGWFSQGLSRAKNGKNYDTVRFYLNPEKTRFSERLIDAQKGEIKQRSSFGGNRKKDGTLVKGDAWIPPGTSIDDGDEVYLVEGIFHAIALHHSGKKAAAIHMSGNFPENFIEEHLNKRINWILALDNDSAGTKAALSHAKKLKIKNQRVDYCLLPIGIDMDDAWRLNDLNPDFLKKCRLRGRIEFADSLQTRAFWLYEKYKFKKFVAHFGNQTYSVSVGDKLLEELSQNTDEQGIPDRISIFQSNCKVSRIANYYPVFLYSEKDQFRDEISYVFRISHGNGKRPDIVRLSSSMTAEAKSFHRAVLNQSSGAWFEGGLEEMNQFSRWWFKRPPREVRSIPFIGYHDGIYVFGDRAYMNGRGVNKNEHGFFDFGDQAVKSSLNLPLKHSQKFDPSWINSFLSLYGYNGLASLSFWTMSLFATQIRKRHQSLFFLEIVGLPGTGKSSMIFFLWKLLGREDYEGFDPNRATIAARARNFEQVSGMPVVLTESDREDEKNKIRQFDWDELKTAYNGGVLRPRAPKNNGNETMEQPFRGTVVISQNAEVDGSQALMQRLCQCFFDFSNHSPEGRRVAVELEKIPTEELAGYLHQALTRENAWLESFFAHYEECLTLLEECDKIKIHRVRKNHAQWMAGILALNALIPDLPLNKDRVLQWIIGRAKKNEERLGGDHPDVEAFWDLFHLINDGDANRRAIDYGDLSGNSKILNHSVAPDSLIAINFIHMQQACIEQKAPMFDLKRIQKLIKNSKRHPFVEVKSIHSAILKKNIKCWIFKTSKS